MALSAAAEGPVAWLPLDAEAAAGAAVVIMASTPNADENARCPIEGSLIEPLGCEA